MENEDLIYRRLQQHLDRMPAGFPAVESGLDLRLLQRLFTPKEARLAVQLSMKPEPLNRIYQRVKTMGISLGELQQVLNRMAFKGTILVSELDYREKHYSSAAFSAGGIYNFQVDRLTKNLIHEYWQYQAEIRSRLQTGKKRPSGRLLPLRTIPVEKSIPLPEKRQISRYDDVRSLIENVRGKIAVANCICRQSTDILGEPCFRTNLRETCLIIGPEHARRHVEMGIARFISGKEALDILTRAQRAGLVLQPENTRQPEAICCCCGDCCVLLKQLKKVPRPVDLYATNYFAEVNPELCNGCQACVTRCQLDARVMRNGVSTVNLDRCIGCGNCVTLCPVSANSLRKKKKEISLLKDKEAYNMKLLSAREGQLDTVLLKLKMLMGLKV